MKYFFPWSIIKICFLNEIMGKYHLHFTSSSMPKQGMLSHSLHERQIMWLLLGWSSGVLLGCYILNLQICMACIFRKLASDSRTHEYMKLLRTFT